MEKNTTEVLQAYKLCPGCNFFCHISEKDQFCSLCGKKLVDRCPECSEWINNPYAKYCKRCGSAYPGKTKKSKQSF